jgi:hypothetical protein
MSFYLFNNVFRLHLALKPAKSVLEGFSLLKSNFCQTYTPPSSSEWDANIYDKILTLSQEEYAELSHQASHFGIWYDSF